jgi:aspartate carbamoyltransferase regulatory subunit
MKKTLLTFLIGSLMSVAMAQPLETNHRTTILSVLKFDDNTSKSVTLNLDSGKSFTGVITTINDNIIHLKKLEGMEYYDAVITINSIESIVLRTKD